jgi:ribose-phosphate pyrophosphokinase
MPVSDIRLFALSESRAFGEQVCEALGVRLAGHEERSFEDGEHKIRPLENVRGRDVFVIQSLYDSPEGSVNDKLVRFLFFLGALRDASAARVTAMVPYLCYARKDRKTKTRDPVTTRYVAQMLEAVGTDRIVTMDVHNLAAYQNAFRCRSDHLEARRLFAEHFAFLIGSAPAVVVSPDIGGVKRAEAFRTYLAEHLDNDDIASAFMEKHRSAGVVSGEAVVGDVEGKAAIIIDDLISTGGTIARTANACLQRGAGAVYAAATHGLFVGDAGKTLSAAPLEKLVITDTVPPFRIEGKFDPDKLTVLSAAPLFAEAIRRIHEGGSIVELLEG